MKVCRLSGDFTFSRNLRLVTNRKLGAFRYGKHLVIAEKLLQKLIQWKRWNSRGNARKFRLSFLLE